MTSAINSAISYEEGLLGDWGPSCFFTMNYPSRVRIETAADMHALGMRIGAQCRAGDLILLNGPLGAGKTVLVQGIGQALGINDVTSPTFVISRIHHSSAHTYSRRCLPTT